MSAAEEIKKLDEFLDSLSDEDDHWIRVSEAQWREPTLVLQLEILRYSLNEIRAHWAIECSEVVNYLLRGGGGEWVEVLPPEHPVLWQYSEVSAGHYFADAAKDPLQVIGALWSAHWKSAGSWVPFDKHLNLPYGELAWLLGKPQGKLAEGPRSLMDVYAGILGEYQMRPSIVLNHAAVALVQREICALGIGESFVVCREIRVSRID